MTRAKKQVPSSASDASKSASVTKPKQDKQKQDKQSKDKGSDQKIEAKSSKKDRHPNTEDCMFVREYWTGDSRDGVLVNGDGYHYYKMTTPGKILEAYEYYETEDGREFANPLPEMLNIHWIEDLGFEDFDALDTIKEFEFERIKDISHGQA